MATKGMSLSELKAYKQQLRDQGKTLSTSKEMGKVEDLIKTKQPESFGGETVSRAFGKLSSGVSEMGGFTEANLDNIEQYTGTAPQLGQPSPQQAAGIGLESGGGMSGLEGGGSGLDLSGLTSTQRSAIQAQMSQPSYTSLWDQYRNELGLGEKENLISDLNKNIFDIEDEIEAIETDFDERVSGDFLITESQKTRRESAEKLPLREQYEDLLTRRERIQGEITSGESLLEQQLNLAQSDMERITGIYQDVASYTESNQTSAQEKSLYDLIGNLPDKSIQDTSTTQQGSPRYTPAGGEGAISDDGQWVFSGGRWVPNQTVDYSSQLESLWKENY